MEHSVKARELFQQGYSCSQSVVGAFCDELEMPMETAMKLASSFGGGMGGLREICGAVTGMFMVAGLLWGYDLPEDYEGKKNHYARIRKMGEGFKDEHETWVCRELLAGMPGKLQKDPLPRTEEYYKVRPCVRYVETAAKILDQLLEENGVGR